MMLFNSFVLSFVFVVLASAADDKQYCGHTYVTNNFYEATTKYYVQSTVVDRSSNPRSALLAFDSSSGEVILSRPYKTGVFEEKAETVATGFCTAGRLLSADIDGDSYDDLLCKKAGSNLFSARLYNPRNKNYLSEEDLSAIPACSFELMIGDFDGNKADDIMCLKTDDVALIADASYIYFNSDCKSQTSHDPNHPPPYPGHVGSRFRGHHHHHHPYSKPLCPMNLPALYYLPAGDLTGFDPTVDFIIVADVDGNGRDDLVVVEAGGGLLQFFLSSGATIGTVFGSINAPTALPVCDISPEMNEIIAADVDGDGDDDIVCVNQDTTAITANAVSFFTSGDYVSFAAPVGDTCSTTVCSVEPLDASGAGASVSYQVGDFNGDGADDYMCRIDKSGFQTGFVYSAPRP